MSELTIQERVEKSARPIVNYIARQDPETVFHLGQELIDASKALVGEGASLKRAAIRTLRAQGYTLRELAEMFGVTSARIGQIETGD